VQDPLLDIQVERVHLIVAADDFLAQSQIPVGKGPQRLLQQQLGLDAGPLDLALKGAQLFMEALPDLGHQPTLPCPGALVLLEANPLRRPNGRFYGPSCAERERRSAGTHEPRPSRGGQPR
jgi:hypothetical protein